MVIGIDCSRAFVNERTGTENYSYEIITRMLRLRASRAHHFVLFIRPNAFVPRDLISDNAEVVVINYRYLWTQVGLAHATWRHSIDVLWVPAHTLPVLRKPGIHTVVTIHGLEYRWLPEYKNLLQRWYLPLSTKYAAHFASRLIAVSTFTKLQLIEEFAISPAKITMIHEGVETAPVVGRNESKTAALLEQYGLQPQKYILFVGTLQPRKNLVALIRAFSMLPNEYHEYRLAIVGKSGWMTEEIYRAAIDSDLSERIIFAGRVTDEVLATLYSQATLYVQPSLQEGFGLPILESMRYGLPIVASDGGAIPEIVGDAGIIVPLRMSGFARRMCESMHRVLRDRQTAEKLANASQKRVRDFSWDKTALSTLNLLINY